jgi:hypothetical protein
MYDSVYDFGKDFQTLPYSMMIPNQGLHIGFCTQTLFASLPRTHHPLF